jgi:transposase
MSACSSFFLLWPPLPMLLQVGKQKEADARGPTKEEFREYIKNVQALWMLREMFSGKNVPRKAVFSWDNAKIHSSVLAGDWADLGISTAEHTLLPPYSPDMHSVIELTHAELMRDMSSFISRRTPQPDEQLQLYTSYLQHAFTSRITPAYVQATTHRLSKCCRRSFRQMAATRLSSIVERSQVAGPANSKKGVLVSEISALGFPLCCPARCGRACGANMCLSNEGK